MDRSTGTCDGSSGGEREKRAVSIGSHAMIGLGSYLGAGVKVGDGSMVRHFRDLLRRVEENGVWFMEPRSFKHVDVSVRLVDSPRGIHVRVPR